MRYFKIGNREIGDGFSPLVIAEIGINHNGNLDLAIDIADSAMKAGAEVIKHQTHIIEDEMSIEARKVIPGNSNKSIYQIMQECSLNKKDERKLMQHIKSNKCIFLSSPFSRKAVDRLIEFDVPAIKIGSGECNNYPLIKYICKFKIPLIVSTGMNNLRTIKVTTDIMDKAKVPYALLHCTNVYPTPEKIVRLDAISLLRKKYKNIVIGYSDHTTSNFASLGSVALGASIIEKHFIDSKKRKGPDIVCSMSPKELKNLITGTQKIFLSKGNNKKMVKEEIVTSKFAFASVVAIKDIKKNEKFSYSNIWVKRPSGGFFPANKFEYLLTKKASRNIKRNHQLKELDVK